tara:strand:- start:805 stop:966 length:162 start_codon:yes stop_codon:yes gene_type:complete
MAIRHESATMKPDIQTHTIFLIFFYLTVLLCTSISRTFCHFTGVAINQTYIGL